MFHARATWNASLRQVGLPRRHGFAVRSLRRFRQPGTLDL